MGEGVAERADADDARRRLQGILAGGPHPLAVRLVLRLVAVGADGPPQFGVEDHVGRGVGDLGGEDPLVLVVEVLDHPRLIFQMLVLLEVHQGREAGQLDHHPQEGDQDEGEGDFLAARDLGRDLGHRKGGILLDTRCCRCRRCRHRVSSPLPMPSTLPPPGRHRRHAPLGHLAGGLLSGVPRGSHGGPAAAGRRPEPARLLRGRRLRRAARPHPEGLHGRRTRPGTRTGGGRRASGSTAAASPATPERPASSWRGAPARRGSGGGRTRGPPCCSTSGTRSSGARPLRPALPVPLGGGGLDAAAGGGRLPAQPGVGLSASGPFTTAICSTFTAGIRTARCW